MLPATEAEQPQPEPGRQVEAELASFTLLSNRSVTESVTGSAGSELPGQLDLTEIPGVRQHTRAGTAMIENLQAHYGSTRSPFGKALAPQMLHRHQAHGEAVARIGWCLNEKALGVITGEVGAGKTVAVRAALAGLDASRTTVVYLVNRPLGPAASTPGSSSRWAAPPGIRSRCSFRRPRTCSPRSTRNRPGEQQVSGVARGASQSGTVTV